MQDSTRQHRCQHWPLSKGHLWAILAFIYVATNAFFYHGYRVDTAWPLYSQSNTSMSEMLYSQSNVSMSEMLYSQSNVSMSETSPDMSPLLEFKEEYLQIWSPPFSKDMDANVNSIFTSSNHIKLKEKLIVFFNPPEWLKTIQNKMACCSYNNCRVSFDKGDVSIADAVVFHAVYLRGKPPKRPSQQIWVLCGWESPVRTPDTIAEDYWKGAFNYTMTYRTDSDFFAPVGMFVKSSAILNLTRLKKVTRRKKRTAAWFVSRCHVDSRRDEYVGRMRKIIDVDIYGMCGNTTCGNNFECLDMLSREYKFYLSFENAICKDYVTEKLFKTFNSTCVPVVRGGADYASLVPSGTYINTRDFSSPESLAQHLKDLSKNTTAYLHILMKKERFRAFGSYELKVMAFCKLCYLLNNPGSRSNSYNDVNSWYRRGICRAPTDV